MLQTDDTAALIAAIEEWREAGGEVPDHLPDCIEAVREGITNGSSEAALRDFACEVLAKRHPNQLAVYQFEDGTWFVEELGNNLDNTRTISDEHPTRTAALAAALEAAAANQPHKHGWCVCRICGHRHMSVWPVAIVDENRQECPECGHMTCEPEGDPNATA